MMLRRTLLLPAAVCLAAGSWSAVTLAQQSATQSASEAESSTAQLGSLRCSRIVGTGYNFLITSKAEVRCIFSGQGESEQWYKGETHDARRVRYMYFCHAC